MKRSYFNRKRRTIMIDAQGQRIELSNKKPRLQGHNRNTCAGGCSTRGPRWHHSIEESIYCNKLMALKSGGYIQDYKTQVPYRLWDPNRTYTGKSMVVDFEVVNAAGKIEVHEYKGFATEEYRLKRMLFNWCYPEVPYFEKRERDLT